MLELDEPLQFSETIQPIALPDEDVDDSTICLVSGWGLTMNEKEDRVNLRAAEVPVVNQHQCEKEYKPVDITKRMIW